MFREYIMDNGFFKFHEELGVHGRSVSDNSLPTTFAALMNPRGEQVTITTYPEDWVDNHCMFYFVSYGLEEVVKDIEGVEQLNDVMQYFKQRGCVSDIRIVPEKKSAYVYLRNPSNESIHLVQSVIPRLYPEVFKEKPLTELELQLLKALSKKDGYILYNETISKMAEAYDFREMQINKELTGFEIDFEREKIRAIDSRIRDVEYQIRSFETEISKLIRDRRGMLQEKIGIELFQKENDSNGLRDLFLSTKSLELAKVENHNVCYYVNGYISVWDEALMESLVTNKRSIFYRNTDSGNTEIKSKSDREKLLTAILVDRKLKIRAKTGYTLKTGDQIYIDSYNAMPDTSSRISNPHIVGYDCLGGNRDVVRECLSKGDYVGAIIQTTYSATQISAEDTTVMDYFVDQLFNKTDVRFVELPDGTCVTSAGAINWLNEQEKEDTDE